MKSFLLGLRSKTLETPIEASLFNKRRHNKSTNMQGRPVPPRVISFEPTSAACRHDEKPLCPLFLQPNVFTSQLWLIGDTAIESKGYKSYGLVGQMV